MLVNKTFLLAYVPVKLVTRPHEQHVDISFCQFYAIPIRKNALNFYQQNPHFHARMYHILFGISKAF